MYYPRKNILSHHGVVGQEWGKKNGPPYPLKPSDHSVSEKKAGWRKSLEKTSTNETRTFLSRNKDGTYTEESQRRLRKAGSWLGNSIASSAGFTIGAAVTAPIAKKIVKKAFPEATALESETIATGIEAVGGLTAMLSLGHAGSKAGKRFADKYIEKTDNGKKSLRTSKEHTIQSVESERPKNESRVKQSKAYKFLMSAHYAAVKQANDLSIQEANRIAMQESIRANNWAMQESIRANKQAASLSMTGGMNPFMFGF